MLDLSRDIIPGKTENGNVSNLTSFNSETLYFSLWTEGEEVLFSISIAEKGLFGYILYDAKPFLYLYSK